MNRLFHDHNTVRVRFFLCLYLFSLLPVQAVDNKKPWTFWYWMYGAVSKEGIHADLVGMKEIGLGGCYLMPIRSSSEKPEYEGRGEQLSPEFWNLVGYAMQQADSLGLQLGIHICDGFALAGGPWISPKESMQKIVCTDTIVVGKLSRLIRQKGGLTIRRPYGYQDYYEDIATFAIPIGNVSKGKKASQGSTLLSPLDNGKYDFSFKNDADSTRLTMSSTMKRNARGIFAAAEPAWIQYDFGQPQTFRNVEIAANGTNMQAQRMAVEVSNDGVSFRRVKQLLPPRQGWQNYDYNTTFAFAAATARYWRLSWTPEGTEPGSEDLDASKWRPRLGMKDAVFHVLPCIDNWEGKAGFVWRIAPETTVEELPDSLCYKQADMIRLTLDGNQVSTLSREVADSPKSVYRILRIGHTSTGYTNATGGGGKGLECDKFSKAAVNKQIDNWFARFDSLARTISPKSTKTTPLRYLHVDSWECGGQNWSSNFADEFKSRRGYDLLPYLPLMVGVPIESVSKSEEVLRDVRFTINDLIHDSFFSTVRHRAHEMDMGFSSESIAPTMISDGLAHYEYADIPMGEYWLNSPTHDKPNDMLDAISGAHIYGKPIVQAEGFTEVRGVWDETPAMVKPLLDRNFALGMNKLFFHVTAHNPWLDRRPGMTLDGIGLFFQRDNTWYREAKGFVDYVKRCQEILQSGHPVVDIAVFTGEEMPSRAVLPERLLPMLPGVFGTERVAAEQQRLANDGLPMIESPVGVWHSAGIVDTKDWVNPLRGYHYDSVNKDVLLRKATVEDSCIVLPGGAKYRVLVLPSYNPQSNPAQPIAACYSDEVLQKIDAFRKAGVVVIDKPYVAADFSQFGLPPDAILPEHVAYTHIKMDRNSDMYFLSNQESQERTMRVSFRGGNCQTVFLTDPVTGKRTLPTFQIMSDRTEVELTLPAYGSVFVGLVEEKIPTGMLYRPLTDNALEISAPWQVVFEEHGACGTVSLPDDWTKHESPKEKYYSGHVSYTTTFNLQGKLKQSKLIQDRNKQRVLLSLGEVHDLAHVYVNGIDCGIAWTAPYEVDIADALQQGDNTLCVEVVNTWHNALKGADAGLSPFEGIWTNARYRTKGEELLPAGLFGPVQVKW